MPAADTKTEQLIYALGHRDASTAAASGCCNTKTQSYILEAIDRVNGLEDQLPMEGETDPTTTTVGYTIGQIYTNTTTGKQFILKSIVPGNPTVYTWQPMGEPEEFVFTLADSTIVTKNIMVA